MIVEDYISTSTHDIGEKEERDKKSEEDTYIKTTSFTY